MTSKRDAEVAEYVQARLEWLRRIAFRLCHDWQRADDLVQATITDLYVHWGRASAADHVDAYARTILVRKYLSERRSAWSRQIALTSEVPDVQVMPVRAPADTDAAIDVRAAVASLPPGQRAVLVLRFFCDLSVEQAARELGCSAGNVKSQTAKAIAALRQSLALAAAWNDEGQ